MYSNMLFMHQYFCEEMADVNRSRIERFVLDFVTNGYLLKRNIFVKYKIFYMTVPKMNYDGYI